MEISDWRVLWRGRAGEDKLLLLNRAPVSGTDERQGETVIVTRVRVRSGMERAGRVRLRGRLRSCKKIEWKRYRTTREKMAERAGRRSESQGGRE